MENTDISHWIMLIMIIGLMGYLAYSEIQTGKLYEQDDKFEK